MRRRRSGLLGRLIARIEAPITQEPGGDGSLDRGYSACRVPLQYEFIGQAVQQMKGGVPPVRVTGCVNDTGFGVQERGMKSMGPVFRADATATPVGQGFSLEYFFRHCLIHWAHRYPFRLLSTLS